jgi:lactoylglutathione lyase
MTEFRYDHVHLRSPDPDETARYYERMFGAEIVKSVMSNGLPRTDIRLGGQMFFIAQVPPDAELAEKPAGSFVEFTVEPKTIRPGVRIAFVRGPQNVLIEILDRDVA